ncbi:MAG: ATPase, T2SS/T4P/T4SS family, partial [bacterium]
HFALQRAYNSLVRANPLVRDFFDGVAYLLEQPHLDAHRLVDLILALGHLLGATYIHITYTHQELRLAMRAEGALHIIPFPARRFTPEQSESLRTTLKQRSGIDPNNHHQPQQGLISLTLEEGMINARVWYLPLTVGEKITLEMLEEFTLRQWNDLGWEMGWGERIIEQISRLGGLVLIMGHRDSGRTSTLYSLLNQLSRSKGDLILIENEFRHPLAGIAQIAYSEDQSGRGVAEMLKEILVHDPDIIAVDDVDSPELLKSVLYVASNGPTMIGVVPQGEVLYGLLQLLTWGIDPVSLASMVRVIIAQKLRPRLCVHCREEVEDLTPFKRYTTIRLSPPLFVARGCRHCYYTGRSGRLALFEILIPDETFRETLITSPTYAQLRSAALKSSWYTFAHDALQKAHQGLLDVRDLIVIG